MRGWGFQTILTEDVLHLRSGTAEIPCELHFLVANLRDLGDGAVEIILHQVADGVELHSDFIDLVTRRHEARGKHARSRCSAGYFKKLRRFME